MPWMAPTSRRCSTRPPETSSRCSRAAVRGQLTVFTGPMFSGKTEKLIEILTAKRAAGQVVAAFKPKLDNRYSEDTITSHSKLAFPAQAVSVEDPLWLGHLTAMHDLAGIDEVQFFGPWIVGEITNLLVRGLDVVVSGLDLTFRGEPFGPMPQLLCLADEIHKLGATCARCGGRANRSQRTAASSDAVLVGGAESYEPRCLGCFEKP